MVSHHRLRIDLASRLGVDNGLPKESLFEKVLGLLDENGVLVRTVGPVSRREQLSGSLQQAPLLGDNVLQVGLGLKGYCPGGVHVAANMD